MLSLPNKKENRPGLIDPLAYILRENENETSDERNIAWAMETDNGHRF